MTDEAQETAAQRFKRIANPRLAKCQTAIRALAKCSSKDYEYTEEQIATIREILNKEVEACMDRFTGNTTTSDGVL